MKTRNIIVKLAANINDYLLLFLSLLIIFSALVYYFWALNWVGVLIALFLSLLTFFLLLKNWRPEALEKNRSIEKNYLKLNKKSFLVLLIYILFFLAAAAFLWLGRSDKALISPWQVVSIRFFIFYGLASLVLAHLLWRRNLSAGLKIVFLSAHYLLPLAVAVIIYKIGYGYDPFVHQATMELIDARGAVLPKPPYYLGQYGLIVSLHKLTTLSIYALNKILVPFLTALFLPLAAFRFLRRADESAGERNQRLSEFLSVLFLLGLTFSPFIVTTPQNLSYLFLLLAIFTGLSRARPVKVFVLALAALAIHPLTGLPAIFWSAWLFLKRRQEGLRPAARKFLSLSIFSANAVLLPLALFFADGQKITALKAASLWAPFKNLITTLSAAGRETWFINAVYFFKNNYNLWLAAFIIASLAYFYFFRPREVRRDLSENGLLFMNLSLLAAYIFSAQIRFNNLISYEQQNYADRLLLIMTFFFLPFLIEALNQLIKKILRQETLTRLIWLFFGAVFLSVSLYLSYPRFDKYFNSHGYSTSLNDIRAVRLIDKEARGPYLVLADQQVSAAALKELGFNHYYNSIFGPLYFYPIPTGGPLYQYYLAMVYKNPDREAMRQALALVGVNEGYLVVNKYWY